MFTDIHTCRKAFEDAVKAGKLVVLHYFDGGKPRHLRVTPIKWDRMVRMKRESDGATWNLQATFVTGVVPV